MWNKVRELVGDESLSEIVATALQQVIITMECATEGFKDVEIEVGEWSAGRLVKFQGYELARARDGHQIAYLTPKGKILIYLDHDSSPESCWAEYHVFDNLAAAAGQVDCYGDPLFSNELLTDIGEEIEDAYIERPDL